MICLFIIVVGVVCICGGNAHLTWWADFSRFSGVSGKFTRNDVSRILQFRENLSENLIIANRFVWRRTVSFFLPAQHFSFILKILLPSFSSICFLYLVYCLLLAVSCLLVGCIFRHKTSRCSGRSVESSRVESSICVISCITKLFIARHNFHLHNVKNQLTSSNNVCS